MRAFIFRAARLLLGMTVGACIGAAIYMGIGPMLRALAQTPAPARVQHAEKSQDRLCSEIKGLLQCW